MVRPQLVSPPPVMMPPAAAQPAPVRGPTTGLVQPPVSGPTGWPTPAPSVVPAARPVSQAVPAAVPIAPAQPAPSRFPLFRSLFSGNREATPTVTRPAPALTPVPATPIPNGVVVNALSSRPQSLLPGMMPSALPQGPGGVAVAGAVPPVAPANWPVGRACPGGIAPCAAVTPSAVPQPRPTTPVNPTAPYQTTGVAVFEEPAGPPGSAPAINPESLRKQVQAVCGPQAGAVRVDLGPDKIYHVHVPLTDPAAGNAVLERVLTIPEMQNPGVHLDMEMPR